jgi:hypothetical protein
VSLSLWARPATDDPIPRVGQIENGVADAEPQGKDARPARQEVFRQP